MNLVSATLMLFTLRSNSFASCHDCLIKSVGITQILLMEEHLNRRLYWVEGHADIARAFIFHCNRRSICFISLKKAQPNT